MKVRIWGCRGSITSSGPDTLRYGGESTCLEVTTDSGRVIIIDAGSGIRNLGKEILGSGNRTEFTILLTHSHWDHLAGFPFFRPAYFSKYSFKLCGGPAAQDSVMRYLMHQMEPPYFPVDFSILKAKFTTGCRCDLGNCDGSLPGVGTSVMCRSIPLNHPNGGYGFRFSSGDSSFVFLTDNEIRYHHEGGLDRSAYVEFCRNAGLLFHDAHYLESEYEKTRGWGHSTFKDAVDLAMEAGVRRLGLFHHDPDRTDDEIDREVDDCREYIHGAGSAMECFACAEGMSLSV
jgi:phosphoribosyl 1,2-cyclic phosphodiesterase